MNVGQWIVEHRDGPAMELFDETTEALRSANDAYTPDEHRKVVRVLRVSEPTIVLGSSQSLDDVAVSAGEVFPAVVRRRSGGGAVWLDPDSIIWFDLIIRRGDALWSDDVGRSMWWVGDVFAAVAKGLGCPEAMVHRGALVRHDLDRKVCWTGLGPGEVTAGLGGPKLVGVAQKRVRQAALFQVGVLIAPCQFMLSDPMGLDPSAILVCERGIAADRETLIDSTLNALSKIS